MSDKPLRLGLIGCGRVAERIHAPAIQRSSHATLAAVVDVNADRRAAIAANFPDCASYADIERLSESGCDGVIIATPAEFHHEHAWEVSELSIPGLIEKPLAPSVGDNDLKVRDLMDIYNWWGMMAFNRRHWPAAKQLHEIVQTKQASSDIHVRMTLRTDRDEWGAFADTADVLDDLGCHQLDLLRFVFDKEMASISATWAHPTEIVMRIEMHNGVQAQCTAGYSATFVEEMAVQFPEESYTIHAGSKYVTHERESGERRSLATLGDRVRGVLRGRPSAYDAQLEAFCSAIRAGRAAKPDLHDGLAALRAACAARTSADSGGETIVVEWK